MSDAPSIDMAALDRLRQLGGDRLLDELITIFREHAPTRVTAAIEGAATGDLSAVEYAVHSLKSSAGNLGATDIHVLCNRLETQARDLQREGKEAAAATAIDADIKPSLVDLDRMVTKVIADLDRVQEGLSP